MAVEDRQNKREWTSAYQVKRIKAFKEEYVEESAQKGENMKYYIEAMLTQEPFVLAWEAFVLFMLLMFISIIIRLDRIERKL